MKIKIFNTAVFAVLAFMAVTVKAFAQTATPEPPAPPANYKLDKNGDDKEYKQKMAELKTKMADLSKQMAALSAKQSKQMALSLSETFKKTFSTQFKDFGKDFAGSFADMVPKTKTHSWTFNYNSSGDEDYKKKVASGQVKERVKNYSKSYTVNSGDLLQIDNRFGKITVNTWAKNEFKVDVKMIFGSEDESDVNNLYNGTSISDSKTGSTVSFKTKVYNNESNNEGNHQHIEINYTVYMPAGNPLDINNRFGSVTLPDLSGKALIRVSYGTLNAQQLLHSDNDVKVRFGDANIVTFNGGKLDVGYGKLKAGTINNVDAKISFGGISIDRLKNSADVNVKYGDGFIIGTIDKTVKALNITASFTKINLDFSISESFNFDITTKFGSFNYDDDKVKVTSKSPSDEERGWSSTKSYKGYIGKNNSDNKIAINASYTNVRFK